MAAIGAALFGLLAWGAIALVLLVFVYELYAVSQEYRGPDKHVDVDSENP